ncbi:hypothetical protein [Rhodococcus sp. 24CO]
MGVGAALVVLETAVHIVECEVDQPGTRIIDFVVLAVDMPRTTNLRL